MTRRFSEPSEGEEGTLSLLDADAGPSDSPLQTVLYLVLRCDRPLEPPVALRLPELEIVRIGRGPSGGRAEVEVEVDGRARAMDVRVPDPYMSSSHFQLHHVCGQLVLEDASSKNGTSVDGVVTRRGVLRDGATIQAAHTSFVVRRQPAAAVDTEIAERIPGTDLITFLPSLAQDYRDVSRVAPSQLPVLVLGPTGSGKERVASALHQLSARPGSFLAVNCGGIPPNLLEAQLFGHRKGAFSGASESRMGHLRAADRGTLFLDEIGDLPLSAQAALLRALETREVVPVGDSHAVKVDFRLVAATHRDLTAMMDRGEFRRDLYARLAGLTLRLPPLSARREDLGFLIAALLRRTTSAPDSITFSPRAARALLLHDWPLNIRELERCLQAAVLLAGPAPIDLVHLPAELRSRSSAGDGESATTGPEQDDRRREQLEKLLRVQDGNVSEVARAMNTSRMQVHRWAKRYGLDLRSFRT